MKKQDLPLNNSQGLICHKIQPTNHPTDRPTNLSEIRQNIGVKE